ncbi:hypothetical protein SNEBB_008525 [Seison nebaliae]|nr:hypothetical protein SNEBB_008525 [Seison nebaliae]
MTTKITIIPNRLHFHINSSNGRRVDEENDQNILYFDAQFYIEYVAFNADFGPPNLAKLYRYCQKMDTLLRHHKQVVHQCTEKSENELVNNAFLIGCYAVLCGADPKHVYKKLNGRHEFLKYRDASAGRSLFQLSVEHCISAVAKAKANGIFLFDTFDYGEYVHWERVENGDLNWIIPGKLLAFSSPIGKGRYEGYSYHPPAKYFDYFHKKNVHSIVQLNREMYNPDDFTTQGFHHYQMYFEDGSCPSVDIIRRFLNVCENTDGAVAVHCKAGLGRTGYLIGVYLMKHYGYSAVEAIGWIRICRPGSIIGEQQSHLQKIQQVLWERTYPSTIHRKYLKVTVYRKYDNSCTASIFDDFKFFPNGKPDEMIESNENIFKSSSTYSISERNGVVGQADSLLKVKHEKLHQRNRLKATKSSRNVDDIVPSHPIRNDENRFSTILTSNANFQYHQKNHHSTNKIELLATKSKLNNPKQLLVPKKPHLLHFLSNKQLNHHNSNDQLINPLTTSTSSINSKSDNFWCNNQWRTCQQHKKKLRQLRRTTSHRQ